MKQGYLGRATEHIAVLFVALRIHIEYKLQNIAEKYRLQNKKNAFD